MKLESKGRDIFFGVVALATLIVAIVGATLAYFSVTASSNEGAVNATAAVVSIEYNDGQQVTAQADKLIPATLDVVKQVYAANFPDASEESAGTNICTDDNNRQVCSAYRFTIRSDLERKITASLNNEHNGFTYLSYAVYNVTAGEWMTLTDDSEQDLGLNTCSNENNEGDEPILNDDCYKMEGRRKIYATPTEDSTLNAVNSIFGLTLDDDNNVVKKDQQVTSTGQVYDLVLFIKESGDNQNIDQGQSYRGTIVVDVLDGGTGNGNITGCVGPECQE